MKVLKVAAVVVGAVALAATGIGLALGGEITKDFLFLSGAAWATVGAVAGVVAGVLSLTAAVFAGRPGFSSEGNPLNFQTNPNSGLPYVIGRTRMSGLQVAGKTAATSGSDIQDLLFYAVLLSCAPLAEVQAFTADNVAVTFEPTGGQVPSGDFAGWMAQRVSLGETPQATALSLSLQSVSFPGWTSAHKISGMAHALWAMRYDKDGKHYQSGPPEPAWIVKGRLCYDPRLDDTYPGGSGPHRADDESTWSWSRNPGLNALAWCIGRHANGKKVAGIGAPIGNIIVSDFVECANVCDVNGWGCGGVAYTTDSKWDILTRILQAGGAEPTKSGAMIGCRVMTPRVSLGTITADDLVDDATFPMTKGRRDRFNTVLPRYASEAHGWEVITGSAVSVSAYVTADGGRRTKGIDFPFVQAEVGQSGFDGDLQTGQLARYAIENSREAGPWEFTTKGFKWIGLRTGDCVTLDVPQHGIAMQKIVITSVTRDLGARKIRFTAETETGGKHAFALGTSTTPPPAPTLSLPPDADPLRAINDSVRYADYFPTAANSREGQYLLRTDMGNLAYRRIAGDGLLTIGGETVLIGGVPVEFCVWERVRDDGIDDALTAAALAQALATDAQATADGKVRTFYAASAPTADGVGDLWFDTSDGNKLYRWSGSAWVVAQDSAIGDAITAAAGAQAAADGKVTTFIQTSAPTAEGVGDLWIDSDDNNRSYRWSGSAWVSIEDGRVAAGLNSDGSVAAGKVGIPALQDGTLGAFQSMSTTYGGIQSASAGTTQTFGPFGVATSTADTHQILRYKLGVNVGSPGGAFTNPAIATLYLKYYDGSSWHVIDSVTGNAFSASRVTYGLDKTAVGQEVPVTWSGAVTYALFLELVGGDGGADSQQATCYLDVFTRV